MAGSKTLLTGALLLAAVSAADASVLSEAQVIREASFNLVPDRFSVNTFGSTTLVNESFGTLTVNASGTPFPSLTAAAVIGPNEVPSIFGRGSDLLTYAFEILGPAGDVPVLLEVAGGASGTATAGASFAVESAWDLFDGSTLLANDGIRSGQLTDEFNQGFERTLGLTLATNHVYSIFMLADASAAATEQGSRASASAFVDPLLSFGSGVDLGAYSFHFSDGIGNAKPVPITDVPEPGALVLFSSGVLLLAFRRRPRVVRGHGSGWLREPRPV